VFILKEKWSFNIYEIFVVGVLCVLLGLDMGIYLNSNNKEYDNVNHVTYQVNYDDSVPKAPNVVIKYEVVGIESLVVVPQQLDPEPPDNCRILLKSEDNTKITIITSDWRLLSGLHLGNTIYCIDGEYVPDTDQRIDGVLTEDPLSGYHQEEIQLPSTEIQPY